jgi:hypothetical protein
MKKTIHKQHRNDLHPCHSFRVFAVTQMQRAKIDKTIREMLIRHSIGLDKFYFKPQEEEVFQECLKALDALSISNENRLKKQIKEIENSNEIRENFKVNLLQKEDALTTLSDQVMKLMEEIQQMKMAKN